MAKACLARGVFTNLEKPPVPLIQQVDELIAEDREMRVSVAFQGISSPCIQLMKSSIVAGKLGEIYEIRVCGSWPRLNNYYSRNGWAGKLQSGNRPVLDGPATNALSHLIHDIMFLASSKSDEFDQPTEIQGELYQARPMESYDIACFRGRFGTGVRFTGAVAHACEKELPYQIEVRGSKGMAQVRCDGTRFDSTNLGTATFSEGFLEIFRIYYDQFADFVAGTLRRPPTRLIDSRGYVLATNGLLLSSRGIHPVPDDCIQVYSRNGDYGYHVPGLYECIVATFTKGLLFSELGVSWGVSTKPIALSNLRLCDLTSWIRRP
jgi:predicted dehydrogenase